MKLKFTIDYYTGWGQTVCISGSIPELGNWKEDAAVELTNITPSSWSLEIEVDNATELEYSYFIKTQENVIYREWGTSHKLLLDIGKQFDIYDIWQNIPQQKHLYTSGFSESFFFHEKQPKIKYTKRTILLKVNCPYVKKNQSLILCGATKALGEWGQGDILQFSSVGYGEWKFALNATQLKSKQEYKLAVYDNVEKKIVHWEEGDNRILSLIPNTIKNDTVKVESLIYNYGAMNWKAAGVAIPVFSLRSNDSFGIGEFSDLKKLIDWAAVTEQKIIQILPINDTTITYSWTDSYPYNAISIYALHPIYLGLKEYPLEDEKLYKKYEKEAAELNILKDIDYDKVLHLKLRYFKDLFTEIGKITLKSNDYNVFYQQNEEWLFPYACFSYLRDEYATANYSLWKAHSIFDRKKLKKIVESNPTIKERVEQLCFIQYLLHR